MSLWLLLSFHFFIPATNAAVQEKSSAAIPVPTLSPPEGNTTFLGGASWCVARPGSSPVDLQVALDWACGLGKTDCGPIQPGGPCFEPNTLASHASYAFNSYFQQNGDSDIACYFGGTAMLTQDNPGNAKCVFATSELRASSVVPLSVGTVTWWEFGLFFLLLYFGL